MMRTKLKSSSRPEPWHSSLQRVRARFTVVGMVFLFMALVIGGYEQAVTAFEQAQETALVEVSPTDVSLEVGDKHQLEVSAFDSHGDVVSTVASDYTWTSSNEDVAVVNGTGEVTAVAEGSATVTATLDGESAETSVTVSAATSTGGEDPVVARVELSPSEVSLEMGMRKQLSASAFDSDNESISTVRSDYKWESSNDGVATVNGTGELTAVGQGEVTITATLDGHSGEATVTVTDSGSDSNTDFGEWDFVLEDTLVIGDVVVTQGEEWLIGANVEVEGNVRVKGQGTVLAMRPGSSLKFSGADPDQYVGGGMTFSSEVANDIGLWVTGYGKLDIRGTPKTGWNRTGSDPTWEADDEYWISPTDPGDFEPREWSPGDPIPQVDPRVPAAEVINVTRDIVIEGPGHIHIHTQVPQRIEYVQLRDMGVSAKSHEGEVLGRYALHFHMSGEGTRGTVVRGVAAINSRGRGFVPHASHGIEMYDNVSVNSYSHALWWDLGDKTHDLLVDGFAATGIHMPPEIRETGPAGASLGSGQNKTLRNAAISGARGGRSIGFHWNTKDGHREENAAIWNFTEGNVAHNNEGEGIRFWFNDSWEHHVKNFKSYHNGERGIATGAYRNAIRYSNVLLLNEGVDHSGHQYGAAVYHNASSAVRLDDGGPARYRNVHMISHSGPAFVVGHRNLPPNSYLEVIDSTLEPAPDQPKVYVVDGQNPWHAHFIRSGVTPDDFEFETLGGENDGTHILIDHEDGRKWEIRLEGGEKLVQER